MQSIKWIKDTYCHVKYMVHFIFLWCVVFDLYSTIADTTLNQTSLILFCIQTWNMKLIFHCLLMLNMFKLYLSYLSSYFLNLSYWLASVTVKILFFIWESISRLAFFLLNTLLEVFDLIKAIEERSYILCCSFYPYCKLWSFFSSLHFETSSAAKQGT